MANFGNALIGPGSQTQTYRTSFLDPQLVQQLAQQLGGVATQASNQYMNFLNNPTSSPLFQGQLSGLLQSLIPSEQQARTNLSDVFRAAGNTGSSVFGNSAQGLERDILGNRTQAASRLLGQAFPQIVQALQNPMNQIDNLIRSLRTAQGTSTGSGGSRVSLGGLGGGGSDLMNFGNDVLQQYGATSGLNPYSPFGPGFSDQAMTQTQPQSSSYYQPYNGLDYNTLSNPYFSSGGGTLFMPGGQYVSGSPTSEGLYNPDSYYGGGNGSGDFGAYFNNTFGNSEF